MATLTVQHTSGAGLALVYAFAAIAGDVYPNSNNQTLVVQNLNTAAVTITITAQHACNQGTLHTLTFSIPAGATRYLGPFASQFYNDASGDVDITYAGASLPAPSAPGLSAAGSGGTWSASTAWVKISYLNAQGETVASAVTSQAVAASGTLTITAPAVIGSGGAAATGWYAYVGTGASEPADAAKHRQQTVGAVGGAITGITNVTNPVIATTSAHGLIPGQQVTIAGVLGATGANGTWTVLAVSDATHYQITAAAPGVWTSGGTSTGVASAIGTNLTLTANPTTGGAAPLATGTASAIQVAVTAP